jgi:aryl-alcohol dehydrogenase-like predicted oxidoreductase
MHLPETSRFELTSNLTICRILNGMWQVSGAHGYIEPNRAVEEMFTYHDAGFTTWDLADHYGPAENFVGEFRKEFAARRGRERLSEIQAFTKWVPRPGPMTRRIVDEAIRSSRMRMGVESLDLLQFHWWEYDDASYLDALKHLADLQHEGTIKHLALTNFDTEHLRNYYRTRNSHRLESGPVFPSGSPARGCRWRRFAAITESHCWLTELSSEDCFRRNFSDVQNRAKVNSTPHLCRNTRT